MNRKPIIATVAAGLLIAGLPSAVAAAAPEGASCTQWGFNGATSLGVPGGFISFYATGPSIQPLVPAQLVGPGDGNDPVVIPSEVTGGISGDQIALTFMSSGNSRAQMQGHIGPDGSAQGTGDGGNWHTNSPLKCMTTAGSGKRSA